MQFFHSRNSLVRKQQANDYLLHTHYTALLRQLCVDENKVCNLSRIMVLSPHRSKQVTQLTQKRRILYYLQNQSYLICLFLIYKIQTYILKLYSYSYNLIFSFNCFFNFGARAYFWLRWLLKVTFLVFTHGKDILKPAHQTFCNLIKP